MDDFTTRPALRPARPEDFDYCARLYFEGMEKVIKENMEAQAAGLRQRWDVTQVRGMDIGWLQSFEKDNTLFLVQLFVEAAMRGRHYEERHS
jgi:hypothetical protein